MTVPAQPKIYHIVHVDRLPSIISDGNIWCDAEIVQRTLPGTTIGMNANSGGSLSLPWAAIQSSMLAIVYRFISARARSCFT